MNILDDGPLYSDDRPFYYNPEIVNKNNENNQGGKKMGMRGLIIIEFLIITLIILCML